MNSKGKNTRTGIAGERARIPSYDLHVGEKGIGTDFVGRLGRSVGEFFQGGEVEGWRC